MRKIPGDPSKVIGELLSFDAAVDFLKRNNLAIPQVYTFDLSTAQDDLDFGVTGNFFYVLDSTNTTDLITVKFNQRDIVGVPLTKQLGLRTPFDRAFISNTAQAGATMTILVGTVSADFIDVLDNRSNIDADLAELLEWSQGDLTSEDAGTRVAVGAANVEVLAANADRKGASVHAPYSNTNVIFLRLDAVATATAYLVELKPGDYWEISSYRGAINCLGGAAAQNVQIGEW